MTDTILCEDCGVVVATKDDMGRILHRYGVRHKHGCPHNKDKKDGKLYKDWIKGSINDRTQYRHD